MRCNILLWVFASLFLLFLIIESTSVNGQNIDQDTENKAITGKAVTGEAITGEATSQTLGVSVFVIGLPSLVLISPKNVTYIDRIFINYSVSGASYVWYKLDNNTNITINHPIYIDVSEGNHRFFLYANNSVGHLVNRNVTFYVNKTQWKMKNDYWNESSSLYQYRGNSTDLHVYGFEELQNLSNIIFEQTTYGKIFFPEIINVTAVANFTSGIFDISSYINITSNRIEIDSRMLPNFNKSATLTFYNLTLINPIITFDGYICPDTICTIQSYSNGILIFNVTHFTAYSTIEDNSSSSGSSSGTSSSSGGGGGGISYFYSKKKKSAPSFIVKPEILKARLKTGETALSEITITNNGEDNLLLNISQKDLDSLVDLREKYIEIEPKSSKKIIIDFIAKEDIHPDVYVGKIILSSEDEQKEILISLDISSKKALFDVKISVPQKFHTVKAGEELLAIINLFR